MIAPADAIRKPGNVPPASRPAVPAACGRRGRRRNAADTAGTQAGGTYSYTNAKLALLAPLRGAISAR
jgi:hypothetical protein